MIQKLIARVVAYVNFMTSAPPDPSPTDAAPPEPPISTLRISGMLMDRAKMTPEQRRATEGERIDPYEPPPGVIPAGIAARVLAMDNTPYDYVNDSYYCAERFRGYPYLAMLSQLPDYRKMSETIAKQMTRKWIKVVSTGDTDKSELIAKMEAALEKFKVRDLFRAAAELDGFFGRGQIYIDVNTPRGQVPARIDPDELKTPLIRASAKIAKGALRGFTLIEPMWTYPNAYNSNDPLAPDYYKPSSWFVMGKVVHTSRLLMFASRPVPDILKASYNFGGVSLSQLAEPAVNNWLRTRDSVSDMVHSFSLSGIATDMGSALSGGDGTSMFARGDLFNQTRDNRGLLMINKDTEEFFQFNTPLSGLGELQSQAQEQPAAVANIPLVYLLGITPSGLNATSEGEIEVFESYILSMQETLFGAPLKVVFDVIQLSEFGSIDPDISHQFVPLSQMDPEQMATIQKTKADTDAVLIGSGVISPDDARDRLVADEENEYHGLEGNAPDLPDADDPDDEPDPDNKKPAADSAFVESDHPRDDSGKFGSGSGGGSSLVGKYDNAKVKAALSTITTLAAATPAWTSNKTKNAELAAKMLTDAGFTAMTTQPSGNKVDARYAAIGSPTNGIFVNPRSTYWSDPVASAKANFEAGHLSTDNPMGVLAHEIAHTIYDPPGTWSSPTQKETALQVGRYAGANPKEFVSEVVAGVATGKSFSDEVMNLFAIVSNKKHGAYAKAD